MNFYKIILPISFMVSFTPSDLKGWPFITRLPWQMDVKFEKALTKLIKNSVKWDRQKIHAHFYKTMDKYQWNMRALSRVWINRIDEIKVSKDLDQLSNLKASPQEYNNYLSQYAYIDQLFIIEMWKWHFH